MLPGVVLIVAAMAVPWAPGTFLRSVRVESSATRTAVMISADGALPLPRTGVLANPPRIYLDFPGVHAATEGMRTDGNRVVRRVRVAVNQSEPLVTRVVIDLVEPVGYEVDAASRQRGQLTVVLGTPVSSAIPKREGPAGQAPEAAAAAASPSRLASASPQPPATVPVPPPVAAPERASPAAGGALPSRQQPAPTPAVPTPSATHAAEAARARVLEEFALKARASAGRAPAKDVEKYLRNASPALERLERVRPLLASLDLQVAVPDDQLHKAAVELRAIRATLAAIEPPRTLATSHQELCLACELGVLAAGTRLNGPPADPAARAANAASAAAGALMLLERARSELVPTRKRD